MAKTLIENVIQPEVFSQYIINRTAALSAFWQSGVVAEAGATLGLDLNRGGNTVNMPFWDDLLGNSEELADTGDGLSVSNITAGKDIAVLHFRGKAWASNDLAYQLAGDDPMRAIGDLVAGWWNREMQRLLISTLKGAFTAATMSGNLYDISALAACGINGNTFADAVQRLGDAKEAIAAVAMHSAVETKLAKNDLIETIRDSEGKTVMKTFMGKRVIVDDGMPVSNGVYTTYLFGAGAIGYTEGGVLAPSEVDRDILAGDTVFTSRRAFILHPRGVKWAGTAAGATPTVTELETGTNWVRVYESKQVRMVQFKHKLDDVAPTAVTALALNKASTTIVAGATETLVATITPAGATNKSLRWRSTDETAATVDAIGKVTGIAAGSAVIVCSTEDGGYTAVCAVTVSAAE